MATNTDTPKFCTWCGGSLEWGGPHPTCAACGRVSYRDPKLAAAAIIPYQDGIVLLRRGIEPAYGKWSFPSGYVDRGEPVEAAVEREVLEECGLHVSAKWLVGLYSQPGKPVVLSVWHAEVEGGHLRPREETLDVSCFALDQMPRLAFEHDSRIIDDWLSGQKLRGVLP